MLATKEFIPSKLQKEDESGLDLTLSSINEYGTLEDECAEDGKVDTNSPTKPEKKIAIESADISQIEQKQNEQRNATLYLPRG